MIISKDMVRIKLFLPITILFIGLSACMDEDPSPDVISNQEGIIKYNDDLESLIIVVSTSGTYDSQDIYIPNTDLSSFQEGQSVIFSGNITPYNTQGLKVFVGQEFYHISLSDIKVAD